MEYNYTTNVLNCCLMFQRLMPLVLKELGSSDATNRRNAAFCAGELCRNGGEGTLKYPISSFPIFILLSWCELFFPFYWIFLNCSRYYSDILRGLYPLFGESEPDDAVRDNAAGAVARMIMVHPESIPLNQVYIFYH